MPSSGLKTFPSECRIITHLPLLALGIPETWLYRDKTVNRDAKAGANHGTRYLHQAIHSSKPQLVDSCLVRLVDADVGWPSW